MLIPIKWVCKILIFFFPRLTLQMMKLGILLQFTFQLESKPVLYIVLMDLGKILLSCGFNFFVLQFSAKILIKSILMK